MAKNSVMLQGIIEADETYIGGRPRKANKKEDREHAKRGRGSKKLPFWEQLNAVVRLCVSKDGGRIDGTCYPEFYSALELAEQEDNEVLINEVRHSLQELDNMN